MKLTSVISCVLVVSHASVHCQAGGHQEVTVCPDGYSPGDGCVTLDQLLSHNLIKSNTVFKFVPAIFQMKQVLRFENVTNVTVGTNDPKKVNITCVEDVAGFIFKNVSELFIHNVEFIHCDGAHVYGNLSLDAGPYNFTCALGLVESSSIVLQNLTFKHGKGYGLFCLNICNATVNNTVFKYKRGLYLMYANHSMAYYSTDNCVNSSVAVTNLLLESYFYNRPFLVCCYPAFALSVLIFGPALEFPIMIHFLNATIINNTHSSNDTAIGIYQRQSSVPIYILVEKCNYTNNHALGWKFWSLWDEEKNSDFTITFNGYESSHLTTVKILDSSFINNGYMANYKTNDTSVIDTSEYKLLEVYMYPSKNNNYTNVQILVKNVTISNITGWYGAIIDITKVGSFQIINSVIANNTLIEPVYYKHSAVSLTDVANVTFSNSSITGNSVTGLILRDSNVHFSGYNTFQGNKGYNGGGMAVLWNSVIYISSYTTIHFESNRAEHLGGGIYIMKHTYFIDSQCSLQPELNCTLKFANNTANIAGNDLYGGGLYKCRMVDYYYNNSLEVVANISHHLDNYTLDVTSDPLHVCDCSTESTEDCINVVRTIHTVETYPGKLFNLSLVAVGQLLNTTTLSGVPSAIYASLLNSSNGSIPESLRIQSGKRTCSELSYRVYSTSDSEVMVLTTEDNIDKFLQYYITFWQQESHLWNTTVEQLYLHELTVPAYVKIKMLPCFIGFEQLKGECMCAKFLRRFVTNCSIDTLLVEKRSSIWISALNTSTLLYLTHEHCPFDYCKSGKLEFSFEQPDSQCSTDRSGVLCGECKPGYSLTLGRKRCRECSNIYLLLLIPFFFAGVLLILFLSLTDMTVTAGTINGLLFFANIVRENQATFFPTEAAGGFLSVFIAWLNLDFGINVCFYDGLDAYVFTWLQLLFPTYIWLLALGIIVACRHFGFMNKVCGRNIVHVLATLFLLSYTKLQRTITAGLSLTVVHVSDGSQEFVWLEDGNVRYLQGKHIPLFMVSVLLLVALFIPYTLSITLGPWLQSKTDYKVLCLMVKLKPLFDAYFGPLKDKCRYWTGLLLLSRMALSLVSAINVLGDDNVNLLTIITLTFVLLAILCLSGGVYKIWMLSALDSFFLVNIGLLSSATLYSRVSGGSQYATASVFTGLAFAVFCFTLFHHCFKIFKVCLQRLRKPVSEDLDVFMEENNRLLHAVDEGR